MPTVKQAARAIITIGACVVISACATTTAPVNRPCGVLRDGLKDVQGKRVADVQRIDRHYVRGRAAGCWQ